MGKGFEKIFFFPGSSQRKLLGILYYPSSPGNHQTGIVYCHPFTEEKNMSHSVAVKACRAFSELGFPVLRFDMSGCGDSMGDFEEATVPSWMEDIGAAVEVIKHESGAQRIALFGLRLGGGLALLHAQNDANLPFLILWEPVLDFDHYIRQFLRRSIASQIVANAADKTTVAGLERQLAEIGMVNVIGYSITRRLFDSICSVSRKPSQEIPSCPTLVLSISQMDKPSSQLCAYRDVLKSSANASVTFDHIRVDPFWDRYWRWECPEVIQRTMQWLEDTR